MSEAEQTQGTAGRLLAGRYRLGDVLGRGGMGTVWRASDETLGRTVAVKELRFPANIDEDEKRRLITRTLREAKAIARIRSAGAVTVYDVVHEDDRPWIVMELIEGRSLADVIREDGPLKWRRAAEVGLAVLDVLSAAHRQGILHRDVKPSNVLISDDGRVVLTDFGIAQVEGDPSVTSTGMLVGAPSYISPERARGHKPGPPADLWSLGGLLYAAVEGVPPYDKGSAIATLTAVMTEPLGPPKNAGPLAEVMYGLLAKDPEKRLDEAGARALLTDAVNAPDERLPPKPKPAAPDLDATQAIAVPPIPESAVPARPQVKPAVKRAGEPVAKPAHAPSPQGPPRVAPPAPGTPLAAGADSTTRQFSGDAPGGRGSAGGSLLGTRQGGGVRKPILETVPRRTLVVAAVVVVLAVLGTVLAFALSGGDDEGGKEGKSATKHVPSAGASGKADAQGKGGKDLKVKSASAAASAGAAASASVSVSVPGGQGGPDIAGFKRIENDEYHFTIAVPEGWKQTGTAGEHSGAIYSASGGFPRVQVDFGSDPKSDAAKEWRDADAGARHSMPNYKGLSVQEIRGWEGHDYPTIADWSFERDQNGRRVQVLNRGFKVDDERGYAIMITCEKGKWGDAECRALRDAAFRTFTPED
ncbi:serine/threonine protein kinase [Streptomyces rectiverticillatus]|uniref:serine/threonine-protein kinase n=1 Tax=Streptomyces rectiverticillatus TaxID=173860 RepID=UPI0015C3139E|nr:serine/threonine-protein kinase [Streptomyces rectiverticillatus]QLE72539.1 serine/threonine protein kinase [Streptomyces rectiverticillatus]